MARVAELSAEVTADTGDFEKGLANVEKAIKGTRTSILGLDKEIKVMGHEIGSASDALNGMGIHVPTSIMAGFGQAVGFAAQQMKAAVNETVDYAKQVRDLGRSIGATAEETSMLIQAADDVNVSFGSLSSALEAGIRKGVEPSIKGIGELADQYNAIQDPIARTKFLMDNFGRSGADLAPLMEQGAAGIREMGQAAEDTGLVMSKEAVAAAREYEKALDGLEETTQALKLSLGQKLIPTLTDLMDNFNKGQMVVRKWDEAIQAGVMTTYEADAATWNLHTGVISVDDALKDVTERLAPLARGMANASNMVDMFTGSQLDGVDATDQAAKSARYWTTEMWKAVDGAKATAKAADGMVDPLVASANAADRLAAGLAGKLQSAQEDYQSVMEETTPEIARLTAEIAKYQKQQGTSITVTGKATTTINEYELGALKAAEAQKKLAEFTGDDALELAQLRVNADHAQEAVTKLGEGMGWSATTTADFTKAIAEDSAAMAELVKKQEEAETAVRKATAEMVLQRTAALLGDEAAAAFAHATGLMSDADYTLVKATQAAIAASDIDRSGTIDSTAERAKLLDMTLKLTDQTGDLATGTYNAAQNMSDLDARLPPVAAGLDAVTTSAGLTRDGIDQIPHAVAVDTTPAIGSLNAATGSADLFHGSLDRIPREVHVSVITDNYQNYHGYQIPGTGGGNAAGVSDFIVPPGYPHDSYMMNVQSGERVSVTPAGGTSNGGNGTTYNFNFNNAAPITVPTALQTARATAGAW